jgi:hypothetical protein
MPQATLSDRELIKKTLKTVGVMVGSTAIWLGGMTLVVVLATGSSASATSAGTSAKADKAAAVPAAPGAPGASPLRAGAGAGVKSLRRAGIGGVPPVGSAATSPAPAKAGDPI